MRSSFLLEPPPSPLPYGRAFLRQARFRLHDDYLVKISRALAEVTDEQIWWRPNEDSNSIGNLILHLCGNARQWIVAGVGGAVDTRDRAREFEARGGIDRRTLVSQLEETVREVDGRLSELDRQLIADASDAAAAQVRAAGIRSDRPRRRLPRRRAFQLSHRPDRPAGQVACG